MWPWRHVSTGTASHIAEAGLALCPVAFNRGGLNPLEEFRTLIGLARIYRREAPDIVHHVALKPVLYGSLAARILRNPGDRQRARRARLRVFIGRPARKRPALDRKARTQIRTWPEKFRSDRPE